MNRKNDITMIDLFAGIGGFRLGLEKRNRWMKLIGNSVSVPVIEKIGLSILKTSVFEEQPTIDLEVD